MVTIVTESDYGYVSGYHVDDDPTRFIGSSKIKRVRTSQSVVTINRFEYSTDEYILANKYS
jgi:hypothetical protein